MTKATGAPMMTTTIMSKRRDCVFLMCCSSFLQLYFLSLILLFPLFFRLLFFINILIICVHLILLMKFLIIVIYILLLIIKYMSVWELVHMRIGKSVHLCPNIRVISSQMHIPEYNLSVKCHLRTHERLREYMFSCTRTRVYTYIHVYVRTYIHVHNGYTEKCLSFYFSVDLCTYRYINI